MSQKIKMPTAERQALSIINHSISKEKENKNDDLEYLFQKTVIRQYISQNTIIPASTA